MTTNHSMKRREECAKYEYDMTSNIKPMKICGYCHGNKVSLATSYSMSWYAPRDNYQILAFYISKLQHNTDFKLLFGLNIMD